MLAAELGFEPRQTESESAVLPLHNSAIKAMKLIAYNIIHYFFNLSRGSSKFFKCKVELFGACASNFSFSSLNF